MPRNDALLVPATPSALPGAQAPAGAGGPPHFPPAQWWQVMARQVSLYTGMESESVPVETAEELMASVRFCVAVAAEAGAAKAGQPLAAWLLAGQRVLQLRHHQGLGLQKAAEAALLPLENEVYREALNATRTFYKWYDIRFLAHHIPGMMDYPLALAVPDDALGVDYINEWLRRRLWEDGLCGLFSPAQLRAILHRHNASWRQLPLNLYEPALACALGRALLYKGPGLPAAEDIQALWQLRCAGDAAFAAGLRKAAARLCNQGRVWATGPRRYHAACAAALVPRVLAAGRPGFGRVFGEEV